MEVLDLHWKDEDPDLGIASEGVYCKDTAEVAEHIAKVKDTVKTINLDSQPGLKEIPDILGECTLLEELNISHTGIKAIPDFVFTLPNLKSLSCCCSALSQPPKGLSKALNLETLHFRLNKDWFFSNDIASVKNLRSLTVDLYTPTSLPTKLGTLEKLEELSLAIKYDGGDVPSLPDSFNNHSCFKRLNINDPFYKKRKKFDLANTAHILSSCPEFESLKLSGIEVGKEHQNISLLTGLKILELRHLLVEGNIFDSISNLQKLEELDILGSDFKITHIPDIFMNMKGLQRFSFAGNMALELPPSLYSLENLKVLEIGSTGISVIDDKIANLKNLEILQVYDNILEKLPKSIFTLPKLKLLNIEENIFNQYIIAAIKEAVNTLAQKDRTIEFLYERQGHRQMVKRLRAIKNIDTMDTSVYAKYCLNAINENPYALKYVNINKLQGTGFYAQLCMAAVRKTCFTLEIIDPKILGKHDYFLVCIEAAQNKDIHNAFKLINAEVMEDDAYIQVCLEAALHNKSEDFLSNFDDSFRSRYSREVYERLCWVAVLHYPPVIFKMHKPTKELLAIAEKHAKK